MDLICKLLEDRGLGPRPGWWAGWAFSRLGRGPGPLGREVDTAGGKFMPRASCRSTAHSPLSLRGRALCAPGLSAAVGARHLSLLSQQKLGLTHSTRVSSECPRSSGSRRAVAGSYTVIRWGGGESFYFVYQTLEKWLPPYKLCIYSCSSERDVLLGSGCVYVFILKTYQQKSSFLCYRLPKIVKSFQFRSFFKCIVF